MHRWQWEEVLACWHPRLSKWSPPALPQTEAVPLKDFGFLTDFTISNSHKLLFCCRQANLTSIRMNSHVEYHFPKIISVCLCLHPSIHVQRYQEWFLPSVNDKSTQTPTRIFLHLSFSALHTFLNTFLLPKF